MNERTDKKLHKICWREKSSICVLYIWMWFIHTFCVIYKKNQNAKIMDPGRRWRVKLKHTQNETIKQKMKKRTSMG